MISVHADRDIQAAIKFVKDEGLKAVFYGAEQGWKVAADLKASGIPVIISPLYAMPPVWDDGYDQLFMNAVRLARPGSRSPSPPGARPRPRTCRITRPRRPPSAWTSVKRSRP